MVKPVHIFVGGSELVGYTDLKLTRKRDNMTGVLEISLFMGWLPTSPVLSGAVRGENVQVYIGGHLAFNGFVDRRHDKGTVGLNVGKDEYKVKLTCRGSTKFLVDSSHQHPTGTILEPTNREVFELLIGPFGVALDWQATEISLNRVRLRDGGHVVDELQRICEQCSLFMYETRNGALRVVDTPGTTTGEAIALGTNVLSFTADQLGDQEVSQIDIKGQLTSKDAWGVSAVINTQQRVVDGNVPNFVPLTLQIYGDATPELISRRVQYEANKRNSKAKKVTVSVFHVQQSTGEPWDVGGIHAVSLPPAGVSGVFEIVEVQYIVNANGTLETRITLSPLPAAATSSATSSGGLLSTLPEIDDTNTDASQTYGIGEALLGVWNAPELTNTNTTTADTPVPGQRLGELDGLPSSTVPLSLPEGFRGADE